MLFLKTFGGLSVEEHGAPGAPGAGAARQRKTLALLALLGTAGRRGMSRDKLSVYLWPESDTEHARSLLKQACYALRRDLHAPELFLGAVQMRLNPNVITSDIQSFEEALDHGDPAHAVALYTGPFLDGFYLAGAGEFERWVEETRAGLKLRVVEALESLATQAAAAGAPQAAVKWWRQVVALDPLSARPALGLLGALIEAGERTAALAFGRVHENRVRQELGAAPEAAVVEVLKQLREELKDAAVGTETAFHIPGAGTAQVRPRATRIGRALAIGGAVVLLLGGVLVASPRNPASLDPDLLAVAPFEVLDPELARWREGLVDVLSRNLDGALDLRAVSPTVAIHRWEGRADRVSAQALGRRTGAGLVLFGDLASVGPDSVRLRATLLDARHDVALADIERTAPPRGVERLADSLSLDLMRVVHAPTAWVSARLGSPGTTSLPALKAFLQGERYLRRFWLDSAIAQYQRALALDTTFALAFRGLGQARSWNLEPANELLRAAMWNRGLRDRDSLFVANDSIQPGVNDPAFYRLVLRKEALLGAAIAASSEDPEVWYQVGETQFHLGFAWADSTWNRARRSFDGAIARDSGFAFAYVHPVEISLNDNDPDAAVRYVRGYLAIPSVNPEGASMRLLSLLLDPRSTRPRDFERELETASLTTLWRLAVAIRSWPDPEEKEIAVTRRLLAKASERLRSAPVDTEFALRPYRSLLARALIHRGHLQEARGVVGNRLEMPAFLELAELGAIPRDTVDTRLVQWLDGPHPANQADHVFFPWLMEGPCYRTVDAALWWAARRDAAHLQRLVRREESAARRVNTTVVGPYARPVPTFARAALALARGDTSMALSRFLAWPDSACPGSRQRRELQFRLLAAAGRGPEAAWVWERLYDRRVPLMLERARLAERMGDRPTALKYYDYVVQAWLHADPELQPTVAEARAALAR